MDDSSPPSLPVDPNLATEQQQAQDALVASLGNQSQGDMASLMARYGTQLALSGMNVAPLATPPAAPPRGA